MLIDVDPFFIYATLLFIEFHSFVVYWCCFMIIHLFYLCSIDVDWFWFACYLCSIDFAWCWFVFNFCLIYVYWFVFLFLFYVTLCGLRFRFYVFNWACLFVFIVYLLLVDSDWLLFIYYLLLSDVAWCLIHALFLVNWFWLMLSFFMYL